MIVSFIHTFFAHHVMAESEQENTEQRNQSRKQILSHGLSPSRFF